MVLISKSSCRTLEVLAAPLHGPVRRTKLMPWFHSGGLEILFDNNRKHQISLPKVTDQGDSPNINYLVKYLCDSKMTDTRRELFELDGTV